MFMRLSPLAVAAVILLAGILVSGAVNGEVSGSVDEAVREAETSHDIQTNLPGIDSPVTGTSSPEERDKPQRDLNRGGGEFLAAIGKFLFWSLVIGLAILTVVYLVRELPYIKDWVARRRAKKVLEEVVPGALAPSPISPEVARSLLEEADRLAARGAYAEAVRLLLFRGVEDIARRVGRRVPPSLTSREILSGAPMSDIARDAFDDIVSAVETTYFGGRAFGAEEFGRCRQSYERFALSGAAA